MPCELAGATPVVYQPCSREVMAYLKTLEVGGDAAVAKRWTRGPIGTAIMPYSKNSSALTPILTVKADVSDWQPLHNC
jgi:hypothetical protein